MEKHQCDAFECRKMTTDRCPECRKSFFCGKEHFSEVWQNRHMELCRRNKTEREYTIDGYELCERILKLNDLVDSRLIGSYYKGVEINVKDSSRVTILTDTRPDAPTLIVDSPESFSWVEGAPVENERYFHNAYWALRCMGCAFSLTTVLQTVLQDLRKSGYKYIQFQSGKTAPVKLELFSLELRLFALRPTTLVQVRTGGTEKKEEELERAPPTHHLVVVVDDYVIDLNAGRFWMFDTLGRPIIIAPLKNYLDYLGEPLIPQMTVVDFNLKCGANETTNVHTKTLLYLLYRRLGLDWKKYEPLSLKKLELETNEMKVNVLNGLHNEALMQAVVSYLTEAETPVTKCLKEMHQGILSGETVMEEIAKTEIVTSERKGVWAASDEVIYSSSEEEEDS